MGERQTPPCPVEGIGRWREPRDLLRSADRGSWYFSTMRTTIDGAGRVVIPKAVRDEARLEAGSEIEVAFRDGRIEITPVGMPMCLAQRGTTTVIEAEGQM